MLALLMQIEGIDAAALPRALKAATSDADPQTAERAAKLLKALRKAAKVAS